MEGIIQKTVRDCLTAMENQQIVIPTFQRGKAWSKSKMSKLFLSLLFDYIVPPLIAGNRKIKKGELSDERLIILDGLQRLRTLTEIVGGKVRIKLTEKDLNDFLPNEVKFY